MKNQLIKWIKEGTFVNVLGVDDYNYEHVTIISFDDMGIVINDDVEIHTVAVPWRRIDCIVNYVKNEYDDYDDCAYSDDDTYNADKDIRSDSKEAPGFNFDDFGNIPGCDPTLFK